MCQNLLYEQFNKNHINYTKYEKRLSFDLKVCRYGMW